MIDDNDARGGVFATASWTRVVDALRQAGIVHNDETVVGLEMDHNGLTFEVKNRV